MDLLCSVALHSIECKGRCLVECNECECFSTECECFDNCECGEDCECMCDCECTCTTHTTCGFYCKYQGDCPLYPCDNFKICNSMIPLYLKEHHEGICSYCVVNVGKISNGTLGECAICLENKNMVVTRCGHCFCEGCYLKWRLQNNTCPLCRAEI